MSSKVANNKKYYFWSLISILLMFGFGFLPPFSGLNTLSMQVIGIFLGLLIGWLSVGLVWPSLLAIVALGLTDYATFNDVFEIGFGNNTTLIIFFMFLFSAYLNQSGLSEFIAKWFLSRKSLVGHPWRFTFAIWISAYLICVTTYVYPAILLMWNITYDTCLQLGYKKKDKYPMVVCIGVVAFAGLGYQALPMKAIALMSYGALEVISKGSYGLNFIGYAIFDLIFCIIAIFIFMLFVKFVLKPDLSLLQSIDENTFAEYRSQKMTKQTKQATVALLVFFVLMVLASLLPESLPVIGTLKTMKILGCIALMLIVLQLIHIDGKPVMNFQEAASSKDISWATVIMFAGTMPIADALVSDEVGLLALLQNYLTPIVADMSPTLFTITILTVTIVGTQFINNIVISAMMVPLMYTFALQLGASPTVLTLYIAIAACCASATPAASAPAAMGYANTEWIDSKTLYLTNISLVFVEWLILVLLIPVATILV